MHKQEVHLDECGPARLFCSVLTLTFAEITHGVSYARDKTKLCCGGSWQLTVFFQTTKKEIFLSKTKSLGMSAFLSLPPSALTSLHQVQLMAFKML